MNGLEKFREFFKGYENYYVVIGGTACTLLNEEVGLDFRTTRDIDIVIIVENLDAKFASHFWSFIKEGEYQNIYKGENNNNFYRFQKPQKAGFPVMLELFSRGPSHYSLHPHTHLLPLHIADDISSLSAILLDDDYYSFLRKGIKIIGGIPVLDEIHLIPFKAKAWCELTDRSKLGEVGLTKHIKKHKKDIISLYRLIANDCHIDLYGHVARDMDRFIYDLQNIDTNDYITSEFCDGLSKLYECHYTLNKQK